MGPRAPLFGGGPPASFGRPPSGKAPGGGGGDPKKGRGGAFWGKKGKGGEGGRERKKGGGVGGREGPRGEGGKKRGGKKGEGDFFGAWAPKRGEKRGGFWPFFLKFDKKGFFCLINIWLTHENSSKNFRAHFKPKFKKFSGPLIFFAFLKIFQFLLNFFNSIIPFFFKDFLKLGGGNFSGRENPDGGKAWPQKIGAGARGALFSLVGRPPKIRPPPGLR